MGMNAQEFLDFFHKLIEDEIKIFTLKGEEYSGSINRFNNFEKLASELGLHPMEILWVYACKHKDSITTFIKDKKVHSNEDILGRVQDLRNYLALLGGMITHYRTLPTAHKWYLKEFNSVTIAPADAPTVNINDCTASSGNKYLEKNEATYDVDNGTLDPL